MNNLFSIIWHITGLPCGTVFWHINLLLAAASEKIRAEDSLFPIEANIVTNIKMTDNVKWQTKYVWLISKSVDLDEDCSELKTPPKFHLNI